MFPLAAGIFEFQALELTKNHRRGDNGFTATLVAIVTRILEVFRDFRVWALTPNCLSVAAETDAGRDWKLITKVQSKRRSSSSGFSGVSA